MNQNVEAFGTGANDHADFWIRMRGWFVHTLYFALHDEHGNYKGTIELSQDVSENMALQDEQKLSNWNK